MEVRLKHLYGREFNKGLLKIEELEQNEDGTYNAGVNFRMIVHSVAAFEEASPENYAEDWNREYTGSQGFSCSYITNDMMAVADINHFCYGFSEMSDDALLLSGTIDIFSEVNKITPKIGKNVQRFETYYSPGTQINNTNSEETIFNYNEMVFKRFQNGIRKQPDYILVFKQDGKIENLELAKKAQQQWETMGINMPIIVVDKDECIEANITSIKQMIDNCNSIEDLKLIKQRIINNMKNNARNRFEGVLEKLDELEKNILSQQKNEENVNNIEQGEDVSKINVFKSGIKATENATRISSIYEQMQNIINIKRVREQKEKEI